MFDHCISLSKLPDISKWDTSSVTKMTYMFKNCESLTELPDFSDWNTSNVENTSEMFNDCTSLICGPNILKMADKFNANIFDNNCINFQKNIFDKFINKLLNKMINENKNHEDLIEQILQDLEDMHYISYFISKFEIC